MPYIPQVPSKFTYLLLFFYNIGNYYTETPFEKLFALAFPSWRSCIQGPLLLTLFKFNPSMDK